MTDPSAHAPGPGEDLAAWLQTDWSLLPPVSSGSKLEACLLGPPEEKGTLFLQSILVGEPSPKQETVKVGT